MVEDRIYKSWTEEGRGTVFEKEKGSYEARKAKKDET